MQHRCAQRKHNALGACNKGSSSAEHCAAKPAAWKAAADLEGAGGGTSVEIKPRTAQVYKSRPRSLHSATSAKPTNQKVQEVTWHKNLQWESCSEQGSHEPNTSREHHAQKQPTMHMQT
jgi:hypothetical protein